MDEYALTSLYVPKYLMSIYRVRQTFKVASGSKCVRVLNMAQLYMQGLYRALNMSDYGKIRLSNA